MDAIEQLKQDVPDGRIGVDRLIDVIVMQQRQLEAALQELKSAGNASKNWKRRRAGTATAKVDEAFSMRAEEKRQQARQPKKKRKLSRKGRRGRLRTADKLKLAERTEKVFPEGVPPQDCQLSHTRPVWRLEKGRAVLVAYQIYRGPKNQYGKIPGVLGRSEFGLEIVVEIAYFVYVMGLSFDKVCQMLQFLQNLPLGKTQADSLLRQLSRHWQHEFDVLCTLLANSLVVHADETSWSIHSVWAFLSEKARVLFFGVHKDAATLEKILDPADVCRLGDQRRRGGVCQLQSVAKVLGASAAQGDQADVAGAGERGVSPVHRSLAGDLSPGLPGAARWPAEHGGPGRESGGSGR